MCFAEKVRKSGVQKNPLEIDRGRGMAKDFALKKSRKKCENRGGPETDKITKKVEKLSVFDENNPKYGLEMANSGRGVSPRRSDL